MKAVLVTGATTSLGRALVRALLSDESIGHVLSVGFEDRPDGARDTERHTYLRADLTRDRAVRELLFGPAREHGVVAIVHAAQHRSASAVGRRAHDLHVEATRLMLRLAERHPTIARFVFRSHGEVYQVRNDQPDVLQEDQPLNLSRDASQWIRDRVEADLTVCARMGMSTLHIVVLRCAEILAPGVGSQLYDYLGSRVCFRPMGYDPMINILTVEDAVRAVRLALRSDAQGSFNIPGRDTLPLSEVVRKWNRAGLAVPGILLGPLYRLRTATLGTDFRYDLNYWRFHYSGMLDGRRASQVLGYEPQHPIEWPSASPGA